MTSTNKGCDGKIMIIYSPNKKRVDHKVMINYAPNKKSGMQYVFMRMQLYTP